MMTRQHFSNRLQLRSLTPLGWTLLCLLGAMPAAAAESPDPRRDRVVEAIERVMPSVVNIATEEVVEYRDPFAEMFRQFWAPYHRRPARKTRLSLGSGVIIDEEGYVVTNLHVVQRASRIWVQLADGREFAAQPIVGTTRRDVALLKLVTDDESEVRFEAVQFAPDDDLLLGETVVALGNPFGLGASVSRGILSSKNRRPTVDDNAMEVEDWLQTDAAINPGSSGGPLINLKAEVVGLNVAIHPQGQGIGFAIPVRQLNEALSEIFTPEVRTSHWFGARLRSGKLPLSIADLQNGSPAQEAGLLVDDVIRKINDQTPRSFIHGIKLLSGQDTKRASLEIEREGESRTLTVELLPLSELIQQRLGASVQEMTPEVARTMGFRPRDGLLVADVDPDSPAEEVKIEPGMVIAGMNGNATPDLLSASEVLRALQPGDRLELALILIQQRGRFARQVQAQAILRIR